MGPRAVCADVDDLYWRILGCGVCVEVGKGKERIFYDIRKDECEMVDTYTGV